MRKKMLFATLLAMMLALTGCQSTIADLPAEPADAAESADTTAVYQKITAAEAKEIMDATTEYTILDVRTEEEYAAGHIEHAVLLPDYEITAKAEEVLPDKEAVILVYCRSGRRSANAAKALVDLGYQHVLDFGGIIDWPYETVQ